MIDMNDLNQVCTARDLVATKQSRLLENLLYLDGVTYVHTIHEIAQLQNKYELYTERIYELSMAGQRRTKNWFKRLFSR